MLKRCLFSLIFMFSINIIFSQNQTDNNLKLLKEPTLEQRMEGTYEIIIKDTKVVDVFTDELLHLIESKRQENQDIIFDYSKYTSFKIYSRTKINSPEFKNKRKN